MKVRDDDLAAYIPANTDLVLGLDNKIEDMQEELEDAEATQAFPPITDEGNEDPTSQEAKAMDASFMSESIYEKIPSPKSKRPKTKREYSFI